MCVRECVRCGAATLGFEWRGVLIIVCRGCRGLRYMGRCWSRGCARPQWKGMLCCREHVRLGVRRFLMEEAQSREYVYESVRRRNGEEGLRG